MSEKKNEKWERNRKLFDKYVTPHLKDIRGLINHYSSNYHLNDDIYSLVLEDFYRYVHTYNEKQKLSTWLGICVKRKVFAEENKYRKENKYTTNYLLNDNLNNAKSDLDINIIKDPLDMNYYKNNLPDELYEALEALDDKLRVPLLLLCNNYTIKEITEHEYKRGTITWLSLSAIKTRIALAKKKMKENLVYIETDDKINKILDKLNSNEQVYKETD